MCQANEILNSAVNNYYVVIDPVNYKRSLFCLSVCLFFTWNASTRARPDGIQADDIPRDRHVYPSPCEILFPRLLLM